ncbi:unnamed protein product [Angiostrongylus costaricensis]|uniref:NR LBD domain-containing protein n=1 Tax=Angiostrongylus costaricensis TaxID=334426 RepID=A0A0R3Q0U8_ANGCS|nr:unnamed protein product [Angiostrongylus costaricensis]
MNPDHVRPDRKKESEKLHCKKSLVMKKKSIGKTFSASGDAIDWISHLHGSSRKLLSELCAVENDVQSFAVSNYGSVVNFSLKSLIADRMLARKNKAPSTPSPKQDLNREFLSIQKVIASVDFIDGVVGIIDRDSWQKTTIEDKVESSRLCVRICASTCHERESSMLLDFSSLCERLKSFSLSPIEYSMIRTLAVVTADRSKLSNTFGSQLSAFQESLHELMFREIKLSRSKSSASAANFMANLIAQLYEVKAISSTLLSTLQCSFPRDTMRTLPYQKILTDIINPEVVDLLITMSSRHQNASDQKITTTTLSSFSNSLMTNNFFIQHDNICNNGYAHQFATPHSTQRRSLRFSSKLPLTMTKSIEDMLYFPGMGDDPSIMNRPLARDWADGLHLTPIFNKDFVEQFFPEFSETPMI